MIAQTRLQKFVPTMGLKFGLFFGWVVVAVAAFGVAACGGGSSSSGSDAVQEAMAAITTQPASQTVATGQTATFTVVATGAAPLTYQWQKNAAAIAGATAASYTTPTTTSADSGKQFTVVVSNSQGSVTSSAACGAS